MLVPIRISGSVKITFNFSHANMYIFHYTPKLALFQGTVNQQNECNVLTLKLNMQGYMSIEIVSLGKQ